MIYVPGIHKEIEWAAGGQVGACAVGHLFGPHLGGRLG